MKTLITLLALQPLLITTAWGTLTVTSDRSKHPGDRQQQEAVATEREKVLTRHQEEKALSRHQRNHFPGSSFTLISTHFLTNDFRQRRESVAKDKRGGSKQTVTIKPLVRVHVHDDEHNHMPPFVDQLPPGPFFDVERSGNVTALVGRTAKLNCRVNQIGNRTVSWLRHRDTHLLTVGRYTYTSDQRFRAEHIPGSEDWPLTVKYAQVRDSGLYECQVSTTPPIKHYIWLNVVEPRTRILGGPDIFINRGSSINLTCVVDYTPQPPLYVIWKHNSKVINYDSERGGISLVTEKGPQTSTNLLVRNASERDSGTYECSPSSAPVSNITVHILNGEHPAAMQHGGHSPQELSLHLATAALAVVVAFEVIVATSLS